MNLNDYFDPINIKFEYKNYISSSEQLKSLCSIHTSEEKIKNIESFNIALIGVVNSNSDSTEDSLNGLQRIREYFYSMSSFTKKIKIYDLGNLKQGKTVNDHSIALRDVLIELISLNIIPIIIGSSEDAVYPNYLAYKALDQRINIVSVDSKINITENTEREYKSPLWKILIENGKSLFSFTNIGYQTHFVNSKITKYLSDQLHSYYRLGYIRSNIKQVEPIFRDANNIGLNISSVRQSDAFGQEFPSPNGYYGEEICQLARYAGLSTKLTSFGIYDYHYKSDINNQTAHLIAQITWYFIDGYLNKISEHPFENDENYKKFIVNIDGFDQEIVFYNSDKTNRWWVEVPFLKSKQRNHVLISCTKEDYLEAGNGGVPERWLKAYQKLN